MANMVEATIEAKKYQAQRDLLIDYIGEHYEMLVGSDNVLDDYVSHQVSADGESITVRIKIREKSKPGEAKNFALTKQRVIKRSDLVEFHKGRTTIEKANVPDRPVAAHQVSWADQRHELMSTADGRGVSDAYLKVVQRYVTVDSVTPPPNLHPRMNVDTLKCSCVNMGSGPTLCEHLRFVYVTGWEKDSLLDSGTNHCIMLPIGMGYTSVPVMVHYEVEQESGKPTGMIIISDYPRVLAAGVPKAAMLFIAEEVSAYPDESAKVRLGPGEGLIKAIRYFEDLIKSTENYSILKNLAADDADVRAKANLVCNRQHNRPVDRAILAQFQAGIRLANPNRDNWLIACAFTSKVHNLCLPCFDATSSTNNVPRV